MKDKNRKEREWQEYLRDEGEILSLIWNNKTFLSCTSVHQLTMVFPHSLYYVCLCVFAR